MMFIDSHCHINMPELAHQLDQVLANMADADVRQALAVSVNRSTYQEVFQLAVTHDMIFASVGTHPEENDELEFSLEELIAATKHPKVVGIGEAGLDYHWQTDTREHQQQRFQTHIQAANVAAVPIIVHTRDAAEDTLSLLREGQIHAGVIHCFTENTAFAKAVLDLGMYVSFSGIVTFKNAKDIQAACRYVPLDRLLIETDAPYLAPVPKRGKVNEPAYVKHTAEFIAQLRGQSLVDIAETTCANFYQLFTKVPRLID